MVEITSNEYEVFFVASSSRLDPRLGTILIVPDVSSWNDFGFKVQVRVRATIRRDAPRGGITVEFPAYFGMVDHEVRFPDARELEARAAGQPDRLFPMDDVPGFFMMLPELGAYRELVADIGPNEARHILRVIRDVVAAGDSIALSNWLRPAIESDLFNRAFLRRGESYFAWKNAAMVLQGVEFEELGRISEELRIRFQLAGRPNEHDLRFKFALHEPILPKRFAILIGKNGVGKSQTLARIVEAAARGKGNLTDEKGERPTFNRILAFHPMSLGRGVFPPERSRRAKVWYRRFSLGGSGTGRNRRATSDLVVQLVRGAELIGQSDRFEIFQSALAVIEGSGQLALPERDRTEEPIPIDRLRHGGEQEVLDRYGRIDQREEVVRFIDGKSYPLSSGELSFVRFAALASLYIENSSLLLFDEPETHLHPNFISQFVLLLDRLLEMTGSAAILATHSVYFVREAFEDQVQILRSDDHREIRVEVPMLKTFGADVGTISYFVFGEDEPSRLAKSVEHDIAEKSKSWEQVYATYKNELSLDLLGEIRAEIEDNPNRSGDA